MITENEIFNIKSPQDFESIAIDIFQYQYKNIPVYQNFCNLLNCNHQSVKSIFDIPFLPIQFFKSHIISDSNISENIFSSSGTTGSVLSKHYIANTNLYKESFTNAFNQFFGNPNEYVILALLPSYLEREGSSLVYMVNELIAKSENPESGFYLNNIEELIEKLNKLEAIGKQTILLGVSYALLDLIEKQSFQLKHTIIMETGGMKGRRKEMVKEELHTILKKGFGVRSIYSEYGMTELLSQAYSTGEGIYKCPPWMKVLTRDTEDALSLVKSATGGINIIDLANYHSCSFIATQDLGKVNDDESFEILGRFDVSDIRGCNLMVQ
ncbi:MAG: phenylacetate-coenzyme A ligase PaaK-like adenylate-forming protein [Flavobacteriaceae bacterium]|uniref:acyl transferase n=1 Tax=Candidatus Marifrigoribacter sp. Uisw_064 TaxID=3230970 RepID=UPI003AD91137